MSLIKKLPFVAVAFMLSFQVYGQATRTPFSTFGIGERYGNATANTQGMAGVGVSQPQYWYLNNQNPALLVYNRFTTFQVGIVGERRTLSKDTISEQGTGATLNYLLLSFPVIPAKGTNPLNRWTSSLGLMPYTNVDYGFQYEDKVSGTNDDIEVLEEGDGGITQLFWANGFSITKRLAVGFRASYLFGSTTNSYSNRIINSTETITFPYATIEDKTFVQDFGLEAGISFSKDSLFSRQRYRLSVGMVYEFNNDMRARVRNRIYRSNGIGGNIDVDTLSTTRGSIYIPQGVTFGVSLSRGSRFTMGTEISYRDWTTFRSVNNDDEGLKESWRIALGGEYTPDIFDTDKFFKRMTYRAGASIEQYPFLANNNTMRDVGINFGFSIPSGRSSFDLGMKVGRRGNKTDNLIAENYFRVFFGVTFNDQWFIKRKFD